MTNAVIPAKAGIRRRVTKAAGSPLLRGRRSCVMRLRNPQ